MLKLECRSRPTSHAAQGAAVDRVIVNVDSMRSAQLVNRKQFYVSISRAGTTPGSTPTTPRRCDTLLAGSRTRKSRSTPSGNVPRWARASKGVALG